MKYKDLPEGIKKRVISNLKAQYPNAKPEDIIFSTQGDLMSSFSWYGTPEGVKFWGYVYEAKVLNETKLVKMLLYENN